jgi:ATP adenylyltransferase
MSDSQSHRGPGASCNIHAPWRQQYIQDLANHTGGCFLCRAYEQADRDEETLVVFRTARCIVVMNRFPYTGGHLLIAPARHVGTLVDLDCPTLTEIMTLTRDCQTLLSHVLHPEGFNVGMNIGRCAGAGLPDHIHLHVVPRWNGDTNFMSVLGGVRVIPQDLADLRRQLLAAATALKLPEACR